MIWPEAINANNDRGREDLYYWITRQTNIIPHWV